VHGFHVRVVAFELFVHSFPSTAGTAPAYSLLASLQWEGFIHRSAWK